MLQALLWDVDGTLAETERDGHRVAFNQAFEALGLPWRWDEVAYGPLLRVTGGQERILTYMALRQDAPAALAQRQALARELHRLKNARYGALVAAGAVALRPGVRELIEAAERSGLRQAIATTTSRANVEALLSHHFGADGLRRFDAVVCGEDVAAKKPAPEACSLPSRTSTSFWKRASRRRRTRKTITPIDAHSTESAIASRNGTVS